MGNPFSNTVLASAKISNVISRLWSCHDDDGAYRLQLWSQEDGKALLLVTNHRSGGDVWYSDLLASLREGALHIEDWRLFCAWGAYVILRLLASAAERQSLRRCALCLL